MWLAMTGRGRRGLLRRAALCKDRERGMSGLQGRTASCNDKEKRKCHREEGPKGPTRRSSRMRSPGCQSFRLDCHATSWLAMTGEVEGGLLRRATLCKDKGRMHGLPCRAASCNDKEKRKCHCEEAPQGPTWRSSRYRSPGCQRFRLDCHATAWLAMTGRGGMVAISERHPPTGHWHR
jgi:hypothetical protein